MSEMQLKEHTFYVGEKKFLILNDAEDSLLAGSLGSENTWEPWQLKLYSKIVQTDFVCLDIGGNIGTSALALSNYAQNGHVYTFEPVGHTYSILQKNIERNEIGNVTAFNIGISNKSGEELIIVNRNLLGNARQIDKERMSAEDAKHAVNFRTETLDCWVEQQGIGHVDLIKVDVEGFELEVLEGGGKTFFGSDSTVCIFEFGIEPQREARPGAFPAQLRDISFFLKLKSAFKNIFLIGRNEKLYPIRDYAQLRFMMMAGYPVEDLLCCQIIPYTIAEMIEHKYSTSNNIPTMALIADKLNGCVVLYNRAADGWSLPSPESRGTRAGAMIVLAEPTTIRVAIPPVDARASKRSDHPVLFVAGDKDYYLDVSDRGVAISLHLPKGTSFILIETDNALHASSYFNNPDDHRQIGVRLNLPDFEAVL